MGQPERAIPDCVDDLIADIAIIFHWPLSEMAAMELDELSVWHEMALDRWQQVNGGNRG
ncbi:MAG: GpE family phage tail protein [Vibrionaceae bacterium]